MSSPLPDHGSSLTSAGLALVTDADGTITPGNATGLYHCDRRLVGGLTFDVEGARVARLGGSRTGPGSDRLIYGVWTDEPDPQAIITRERSLGSGYAEQLTIRSFRREIELRLEIELEAGLGFVYPQSAPESERRHHTMLLDAIWTDGLERDGLTVRLDTSVQPGSERRAAWGLELNARPIVGRAFPSITASDHRLGDALANSEWDLAALTITDPVSGREFTAAGAPHFLAAFGRDALTVGLLTLAVDPERAMNTLEVLATHQGVRHDPTTLEEPGRIVHELRIGDMGVFGLAPKQPYYGTVDATPLFVVLLAECLAWGVSADRIRSLLPHARAAVEWCRRHVDRHGFVASFPHADGIDNQGWKDSGDSMVAPDGTVIRGTTSLVEVQGYVHDALVGLAELEEFLGDPTRAADLRSEAAAFREAFLRHFAVPEPCHLALCLGPDGDPIGVRASNAGHLLGTGIIDDDVAAAIATRLLSADEFSGWGVRTLSRSEIAYNPLGYHVGSVWPHDNAVILRGLVRRSLDAEARTLIDALVDLGAAQGGQLPELLGGFDRATDPTPVPYPASARPQAWAAAVPVQIVAALLGIRPELHRNRLHLNSLLRPDERLSITGVRLGDRLVDIEAHGAEIEVTGDLDGLDILIGRAMTKSSVV